MYQQYHCRSILLGPLVKWGYNASNITGVSYNYNSLIETKNGYSTEMTHSYSVQYSEYHETRIDTTLVDLAK